MIIVRLQPSQQLSSLRYLRNNCVSTLSSSLSSLLLLPSSPKKMRISKVSSYVPILLSSVIQASSLSTSRMPPLTKMSEHIPLAKEAINFFDSSPDPFHAVKTSTDMLKKAGFEELDDCAPYAGNLIPGMLDE